MIASQAALFGSESATFPGRLLLDLPFKITAVLAFLYIFFLWLVLVKYVWEDSIRRSTDRKFIRLSLLLVILFNFPGLFIYLIFRPSATFAEREREKMEEELLRLELTKLRREAGNSK